MRFPSRLLGLLLLHSLTSVMASITSPQFFNNSFQNESPPVSLLTPTGVSFDNSSLVAIPPKRYDYLDGIYNVSMYRNPVTSHSPARVHLGVSHYNWNAAIGKTSTALTAAQQAAHLDQDDTLANERFSFISLLERKRRREDRGLGFSIMAKEKPAKLSYREVEIVLAALRSFGLQFSSSNPGKSDLIRMCRFELHITDEPDILVANGVVPLLTGPETSEQSDT